MTPDDRNDALAWVCEDLGDPTDDEDGNTALGLFSAHVERGHDEDMTFEQGPERAPAAEAIAWARARAAKVIVRCCETWDNTFYSAGDTPAMDGDEPMTPWPAGGIDLRPRRLPGWEHLDRTEDDEPIEWDVVLGSDVARQPEGFAGRFEAALGADPAVSVVAVSVIDPPDVEEGAFVVYGGRTIRMHVRTTARTLAEAMDVAGSAGSRAIEAGLAGDRSHGYIGGWQGDAYPTGSTAASYNAHL